MLGMYRPADLAKATGVHKTSVIRVADALGIEAKRFGKAGERRFTERQAKRIIREIEQRRNPAAALKGVRG